MSVRNKLFSLYNRLHNVLQLDTKYGALKHSYRNTELIEKAKLYSAIEAQARREQNLQNIRLSKMDDLERMEFNILDKYEFEGRNDPNVDPEHIVQQLDRIEVLRRLRTLDQNPGLFSEDEAQCLRLIAKVHLEEPNAQQNLDAFVKAKPQLSRLLYLGQI